MGTENNAIYLLPQLLVTEYIHELQKKYKNVQDNLINIGLLIFNFAKRPGFAMVSQLCRHNGLEFYSLDEVCTFLSMTFSKTLFDVECKYKITRKSMNQEVVFSFPTLPPWFESIKIEKGMQVSQEQKFMYIAYTHFFEGLYAGALMHFGYKVVPTISKDPVIPLELNYISVEEMEGSWKFSVSSQ